MGLDVARPTDGARPAVGGPGGSRPADRAADLTAAVVGLGAGAAVALWWLTATDTWWRAPATAAVAVGDLAGLTGTGLLLGSVLLVARVPWLERVAGLDRLTVWHRRTAPLGVGLITVHVLGAILGYAGETDRGVAGQAWDFAVSWPDLLPAYAGFLLLVGVGVTSWRVARRRMRYETWWVVHLYTYLAIGLSLLHQVGSGVSFAGHPVARGAWIAAHVVVLACVVAFRVGLPLARSLRYDLRLERVVPEGPGVVSVILTGRRLDRLPLAGGQFAQFRFCSRGLWWQAHPYSVSGLPWDDRLRLTISLAGDYAQAIVGLAPGTRVLVEGPYGVFTAASGEPGRRVLLVAGGVGMAAVRTLLEDLPAASRPVLLYRVRRRVDVLFGLELERLLAQRGGVLHVLTGSRADRPMTPEHLSRLVPDVATREVYVCGSPSLVSAVRGTCRALGVPGARVHAEEFSW